MICTNKTKSPTRRPVILVFVHFYLPGHKSGGPVRTLSNMVESLGDEFEFRIVTSDRDMLDTQPYEEIEVGTWYCSGKAWVHYVSPKNSGIRCWARIMRETRYDVLYLNSLFDPVYTTLPLLAQKLARTQERPVVIAPRGELSPGALALKGWKKRSFLFAVNALGLYRNIIWHASTDDEAQLIRKRFSSSCITMVAKNLPAMPPQPIFSSKIAGFDRPMRIVFLSRISKKKNLDFALRVFLNCNTPIQFDIWGTVEDEEYWSRCQKLILSMPKCVNVRYRGVAEHSEVHNILAEYDLFFLPTRGENYGHAIAEALSSGTPVLLSDQTPWRNLENEGVGWDLPLDNPELFLEAIMSAKKRLFSGALEWRKRVYEYAMKTLCDKSLLEDNRQVFIQALNSGLDKSFLSAQGDKK